MSYILDALKKSEAERSNRDHPEFSHRVPFEPTPSKRREIWPYLLVLALLANALVVVYVMWPESSPGEAAIASNEPAPVQRQQTVKTAPEQPAPEETRTSETVSESSEPRETGTSMASDASGPSRASAPEVPDERPAEASGGALPMESPDVAVQEKQLQGEQADSPEPRREPETSEAITEVPDINAMPRSVQRRVPEMTFNAHLHSSNPSSRRVMINDRMLREGDRVGDLVVRKITPAGVVFKLDQHVFQIDVVRDWQGGF